MKLNMRWLAAGGALVGLYIICSSFYVLSETQLALIIRLGAPTGVISQPGLKFKIPFIDSLCMRFPGASCNSTCKICSLSVQRSHHI